MGALVIRADRLFDGAAARGGGATVVVEDGRITDVLPGRPDVSVEAHVVDHGDATILPGLIDTHVHLVADSGVGALDRVAGYPPEQLEAVVTGALERQLAAGVTTVRDLGDKDWVAVRRRDRQRAARAAGEQSTEPTIVASGAPLTTPAGHCHYLGGEVSGLAAIDRALTARAEAGVDIVKVMASGGMNTQGTDATQPQFTDDELQHLVRRSHELGLPVTAHAHALASIEQALVAGADQLEHCSFLTANGVHVGDELVAKLGQRAMLIGGALGSPPPEEFARAPEAMRAMLERSGMTAESIHELRLQTVGRLHRAGVRFVAGRDAGISPLMAHGSMWRSMAFLAEAGASGAAALASGTSIAAEACGVGDRKGWVRRGYDADLLVVDGGPELDLATLACVRAVYLGGRQVR